MNFGLHVLRELDRAVLKDLVPVGLVLVVDREKVALVVVQVVKDQRDLEVRVEAPAQDRAAQDRAVDQLDNAVLVLAGLMVPAQVTHPGPIHKECSNMHLNLMLIKMKS